MKVVELFAGVGGFRLGLERAGHEVIWANEYDKYAAQTYDKNFYDEASAERVWEADSQGLRSGDNQGNDESDKGLGSSGTGLLQHIDGGDNRQLSSSSGSPSDNPEVAGLAGKGGATEVQGLQSDIKSEYGGQLSDGDDLLDKHETAGSTTRSGGNDTNASSINAQGATKNHAIDRRDITTIPASQIPAHDIIVGGFPCQAFSVAGKRRGFDETRGTLFFDIMRIADYHKTKYLFLENVKGLLNHDGGRTFTVILKALDEFGYDVQWQVCNSKDFGVPQNRERVIIIANLRSEPRPQVFPLTGAEPEAIEFGEDASGGAQSIATRHLDRNGKLTSDISPTVQATETPHVITGSPVYDDNGKRSVKYNISDTVPTIRATQYKSGDNQPKIVQINKAGLSAAERVYSPEGITPTLSANGGGGGAKTGLYAIDYNRKDGVGKELEVAHTLSAGDYRGLNRNQTQTAVVEPFIVAQRSRYNEDGSTEQKLEPRFDGLSNTLTAVEKDNRVYSGLIRRLTPVECERLQGFPDNWTAGVSDTQRYKQMGNAVTVNVIEAVAKKLPL
jgi:DNA (cytosine-5)-methyltransferase 1